MAVREETTRRHGSAPTPDVPEPIAHAAAALFATLSRARGRRIFHPRGDGFEAEIEVDRPQHRYDGIPFLSERRTYRGVARLSRAIGIPSPLPDLLGLAFRIELDSGPQDLLLVSSGRSPGLRHLLLPTRGGYSANTYSSILPYRIDEELRMFGAEPAGPLEYELGIAPLTGGWESFGWLRIRAALDPEVTENLKLNPWNTTPGLEPAGPLNGLRDPAYRGSQAGRSAARAEELA
jgi:hypothetical protein